MKYIFKASLLFVAVLLFSPTGNAQILTPVKWEFSTKKITECEVELIFKAKIEDKWHVYGQQKHNDDGPIPTSFQFTKSKDYELVGKPSENNLIKKLEPVFGFELEFFEKEGIFKQKIKIKSDKSFEVKGSLEYMACNDVTCLPPTTVDFTFKVDGSAKCISDASVPANNTTTSVTPKTEKLCECDSDAIVKVFGLRKSSKTLTDTSNTKSIAETTATNDDKNSTEKEDSWWVIFFLGCLAGFSALLTPCVFPMIPMTVSFFTKQSKTKKQGVRNAFIYSLSIIGIYTTIGILFTIIFGVDALHAMSTNVWFNLFFFLMLVVFAVSFLGAFEIVLPSRFVNKMDSKSDKGGLIGIFFMAFTLALVSFSCTSAFIGPLLFSAGATGQLSGPFWGMLGFSTALALPFGLFAAFPGWLNSLPKSGGWLNSVKVTLGFLELALAFKFASNADLVVQAHILTREVFLSIWIVIFGLMGIYLMGGFRLAHDSEVKHLSVTRLFFAIGSFVFTIYLIPGLWGAPLKLISGFPPPDFYAESPFGLSSSNKNINSSNSNTDNKSSVKKEACPNNLPCFHDYDEALAYSKKVGKPLMIDFTGHACVNCRKMEAEVWTDSQVDKILRNDVVIVSLLVDEDKALPKEEQTIKKLGNEDFKIDKVGNKWVYLEVSRYKTNSQPLYVLIDGDEKMLTKETAHYDPDIKKYIQWLDEGINKFKATSAK